VMRQSRDWKPMIFCINRVFGNWIHQEKRNKGEEYISRFQSNDFAEKPGFW